jgi:hypothetical protein
MNSNAFIRLTPPHVIKSYFELNLHNNGFYIAGISQTKIVLSNYFHPLTLLLVDEHLNNFKEYPITITSDLFSGPSNLHLATDSTYFYLINFTTGDILQGELANPSNNVILTDATHISTSIFIPYRNHTFAIRKFDTNLNKNVLGKLSIKPTTIFLSREILEPQIDGVFSTDGMLRYEPSSSTFVYTYFYRNQFICLNDQFKICYRGHTLDTNVHAKIKVRKIDENESTISSPGFSVNRESCINKNWIFINSDMKADNDSEQLFRDYAAIDVYSLKDGGYHFSFYLLKKIGNISSMAIDGETLYTIQGNTLCAYILNLSSVKL